MTNDDDQLPEPVLADVARWQSAQPPVPALDRLGDRSTHQEYCSGHRRRGNRRLLPLGAAATAIAIATGMALTVTGGQRNEPATGVEVGVRLVGNIQPITPGTITPHDVASAQTSFGLELLARRCTADPTANQVLSPASAALALTLLDAGAKGSTQAAVNRLLHVPGWSPQLIAALHRQHQSLAALAQLKVSNHLYTELGIHPEQQVLNDLATAEAADLQTLNFAQHAKQATDAINAQVDIDTKGLIRILFDQPLDPATTTVLTNAIYLNAAWKTPFLPAQNAPFQAATGDSVTVPLMSTAEDVPIRRAAGWTSAVLPYAGGHLQAVVLLATDPIGPEAKAACAAPTAAQITALTTGHAPNGPVTMPKLHLSQTSQLTGDLAALGLPLDGDYSGFGASGSISEVIQKTVLQVDEHGTKAAAATGISMLSAASSLAVDADRPYLLLIQDTATGTPLFLARINDPTAAG